MSGWWCRKEQTRRWEERHQMKRNYKGCRYCKFFQQNTWGFFNFLKFMLFSRALCAASYKSFSTARAWATGSFLRFDGTFWPQKIVRISVRMRRHNQEKSRNTVLRLCLAVQWGAHPIFIAGCAVCWLALQSTRQNSELPFLLCASEASLFARLLPTF